MPGLVSSQDRIVLNPINNADRPRVPNPTLTSDFFEEQEWVGVITRCAYKPLAKQASCTLEAAAPIGKAWAVHPGSLVGTLSGSRIASSIYGPGHSLQWDMYG